MEQHQDGLAQIGQIQLTARDVSRAAAFYREKLGMKYLFDIPGAAFFECGGVRLMLSKPEKPEFDHPSSIVYYRVGDLQAQYELFVSRGVTFEDAPHLIADMGSYELWMCFLRDSEGNLLGLMSEVRK